MSLVLLNLALAPPPFVKFDPNPAHWTAVPVPPKLPAGNRAVWEYAANGSKLEWRVASGKESVRAGLGGERPVLPTGLPKTIKREYGRTALRVSDGWLVGTNHGEFGGSLSWFSIDGKAHRKVTDDLIVAFFRLPDGIYAVEGLSHMGISFGSILRIDRPSPKGAWRATKVVNLPEAPDAVAARKDGTAILVLDDLVAAFRPGVPLRILYGNAPWLEFYPNSAVLSADERKLYIGMRQFVGELDLHTKALRLLVPSRAHLNRLSTDDEQTVRYDADLLQRHRKP